jgi:hypothetical protein
MLLVNLLFAFCCDFLIEKRTSERTRTRKRANDQLPLKNRHGDILNFCSCNEIKAKCACVWVYSGLLACQRVFLRFSSSRFRIIYANLVNFHVC